MTLNKTEIIENNQDIDSRTIDTAGGGNEGKRLLLWPSTTGRNYTAREFKQDCQQYKLM